MQQLKQTVENQVSVYKEPVIPYTPPIPQILGVCSLECCQENIYAGESHWKFEEDYFCNANHFARYMGAEKVG